MVIMKAATPKQIRYINALIAHLESWKISPDIRSPSHWNLNTEAVEAIIDGFDDPSVLRPTADSALTELNEAVDAIYSFVLLHS